MSTHSPLPWTHSGIHIASLSLGRDVLVASARYSSATFDEARANAEFIVRACNAHDDLLAACKKVVEHFGDPACGALFGLRAAIAKAEATHV